MGNMQARGLGTKHRCIVWCSTVLFCAPKIKCTMSSGQSMLLVKIQYMFCVVKYSDNVDARKQLRNVWGEGNAIYELVCVDNKC